MVRSSEGRGGMAPSSKIVALAIFIVVLIVAYSAFWFYLAGQLQNRVEGVIGGLRDEQVTAHCDRLDVVGYPFRIGIACDGVSGTVGTLPASFAATSFRSAAQIYRPSHIISELVGPLRLEIAGHESAEARWDAMQTSTVFGATGLSRASLNADGLALVHDRADEPELRLDADNFQFHARRSGDDLELALMGRGARLTGGLLQQAIPAFDLVGEAQISGGADFLAGRSLAAAELRGTNGVLTNGAALIGDNAAIRLSGPFDIAEDGRISGTFDLAIDDLSAWQSALGDLLPALRGTIETAGSMLHSLGGGTGSVSVQLQLREGRVLLGIIPLGRIPAI